MLAGRAAEDLLKSLTFSRSFLSCISIFAADFCRGSSDFDCLSSSVVLLTNKETRQTSEAKLRQTATSTSFGFFWAPRCKQELLSRPTKQAARGPNEKIIEKEGTI